MQNYPQKHFEKNLNILGGPIMKLPKKGQPDEFLPFFTTPVSIVGKKESFHEDGQRETEAQSSRRAILLTDGTGCGTIKSARH